MTFKELKENLNIEILLGAKTYLGHSTYHSGMKKNLLVKNGVYYKHNGCYVIDIRKTLLQLNNAIDILYNVAYKNQRILFVGTNPIISDLVSFYAEKSAQHHVSKKWQGGMLTNFKVVRESLFEIKKIEKILEKGVSKNKEEIHLRKKLQKKQKCLSGIKDMGGLPHVVIVLNAIDGKKAIKESNRLGIPVIGIADTNIDPSGIDFVIPSNDDLSIKFFLEIFTNVIISGIKKSFQDSEKNDEKKENNSDLQKSKNNFDKEKEISIENFKNKNEVKNV